MRLIDADALSHKFFEIGCHITKIHPMDVMNIISEQPTAYDVEKVVAELESRKELLNIAKMPNTQKNVGQNAYNIAIDIVRGEAE